MSKCNCVEFSIVRMDFVILSLVRNTLVEFSDVRVYICRINNSNNARLWICHLFEWAFVELSHIRMDFCRIEKCQNQLL